MIENRQVIKRVFPELFDSAAVLPVDDYPGAGGADDDCVYLQTTRGAQRVDVISTHR